MKLLLTSAGIKNDSIRTALVEMLGKPIAEANALLIPTAGYGHPQGSPGGAWRFITGNATTPMAELGWKSLGVLELTAMPSLSRERWTGWVEAADVLLVNGGDALYLAHWMRQSGLADLLPTWPDKLWVGLSAGSMVMSSSASAPLTSSAGRRRTASTRPWASSISPSSLISTIRPCPKTPWPTLNAGQRRCRTRPTPSVTTPRSRWSRRKGRGGVEEEHWQAFGGT